ncbi:peptide-methionine (S)-S-oxide reductase MsrA [Variovorax sp. dw_954]|uniref:peptide-methionine (S)-S-oxide reductase MsrA n=1 Tax=Variovorax sp. dw_954 TaxID=2720078 RepID=UPI001BD6DA05|nr:peptide-methionine (S)-S-oxide reductase MsrA [Variovorax sp. dw_954]
MNTPPRPNTRRSSGTPTRRSVLGALALVAGGAIWWHRPSFAAEAAVAVPAPKIDPASLDASATAVLAGGCFWGVQGVYQHVKGVTSAVSGYAGGDESTAKYESVGSGRTGHAEAVRISFDPRQVSYARLLQIYFSVVHDPTQLNRQGPDTGTQYRSAIFAQNVEQARIAQAYIAQLTEAKTFGGKPVVTTVELQKRFYPAEAYHQDYLTLHPDEPYIAYNDLPKVDNLKKLFADRYSPRPVLVKNGA